MSQTLVTLILGLWLAQPAVAWIYGLRVCFVETEGSSQCQGSRDSCSGWSSRPRWTAPFRDDTDGRSGGCNYKWKIQGHRPRQNIEYRLCFQETEGSSQCQGTRASCTGWTSSPSWTAPFRDDTDGRSGGCHYSWKIEQQASSIVDSEPSCRICFKETEGSSQCQGSRRSCSGWSDTTSPGWTAPFRDDTDGRSGGCHYQWYLDCIPSFMKPYCDTTNPCS